MKAIFNKQRQFVYSIDFETDFTDEQIKEGVLSLDWDTAETKSFKNRYEIYNIPEDNVVSNIRKYLKGDTFKKEIIDLLYQDSDFVQCWQIDSDKMFNNTSTFATFVKDKPGYTTNCHLDNRRIVITGMYYFIKDDDPDQSTYFYTSNNSENELRMPTGFNRGWLMGNLHTTWHRGFNLSTSDRYAVLFGLIINQR